MSAIRRAHLDAASAPRIDALREKVAAVELARARALADRGGLVALVDHARAKVDEAVEARARVEALARALDREPEKRRGHLEAHLRATVHDRRALRADLRALRRGRALDLAALSERAARTSADAERAAEVALALARVRAGHVHDALAPVDAVAVLALARTPGAWSRRVEALALLRALVRHGLVPENGGALERPLLELCGRGEHRWVQPAALAALTVVDPRAALAIARERLADPGGGDDFLVRERIVDLAGRGALGAGAWEQVVNFAAADASEHVRVTTARAEHDGARLARFAVSDASHRVRATALVSLAARDPAAAESALVGALAHDPHEIVVRTAAEELEALARRAPLLDAPLACARLAAVTHRAELDPAVRARAADALLAISVFDDELARAALDRLAPELARTPVGAHRDVRDPALDDIDDERLARVLAVLSRDDYALGVDRLSGEPGGVRLYRGEARGVATWRVLHEVLHPSPSKRQAFPHTIGRKPKGALRAPPGGLAELTATRVPGERVLSARDGGWGRSLPLVDDLLSTGLLRGRTVTLAGAAGVTRIVPPGSWFDRVRARASLVLGYARFSELRRRALDAIEPAAQSAYVNEVARVTGIEVRFEPHVFGAGEIAAQPAFPIGVADQTIVAHLPAGDALARPAPTRPKPRPSAPPVALSSLLPATLLPWLDTLPPARELWDDLVRYATSPEGNRLPHLAAYATVVLSAFLVRGAAVRRVVEGDRHAIPLVVGGWGTRGKSGTERLKAALFQGLGHETLVKTTGCEAMFIHAIPGVPAREVFIYRPYDKATVWEQRDLLELARRLRVRVFLWECMALQPDLVSLLQSQWMRDDYSTITNAYPDHEDVQGPSGYDVATVISEFVPTRGNLLTTEEQMLPILRERARERDTKLRAVPAREADLLPADLLARFPYQEHPKNVALVIALARALGVPTAVAVAEMADHVVPDLGVLKEYPEVPYLGRTLRFANGMSANERTGALGNWQRCGFDQHDPDREPATRVVTVVNNRGDRVARSEVFARFLVEDVAAHAHFVIGTNVGGFLGFLREALGRHAAAIAPTHDLDGDGTERLRVARARLDRAFARVKIGKVDAASTRAELDALGLPPLDLATLERLLSPASPGEPYEAARAEIEAALPKELPAEARPHVVAAIAGRRTVRAVHQTLARDLGANPVEVDRVFCAAFEALFLATVIPIHDPATSGDQILHAIATSMPRGARVRIMGVQNIKGTGLDFVYRWVSIDAVSRLCAKLSSPRREEREDAARALALHGDYGLLDAELALAKLEAARASDPERDLVPYDTTIARVREIADARRKKLAARKGRTIGETLRAAIGRTLDYLDAPRRRRMAGDVLDALVKGRMSHATAAKRMREIVARTKGAWMLAKG